MIGGITWHQESYSKNGAIHCKYKYKKIYMPICGTGIWGDEGVLWSIVPI